MPDWVATVVAALVGAFLGSLGAVWLRHRLELKTELQRGQAKLVQSSLYQLQDSIESLWYRFHNLAKGGQSLMSDLYFETTTLYCLGRVLACERLLALSGVYPQLELSFPGLGKELKKNRLADKLQGYKFFHYDRLALAEALIERGTGEQHLSTYLEFRSRYEREGSPERAWLKESRSFVERLAQNKEKMNEIRALLCDIAKVLAAHTGIPTPIVPDTERGLNA